MKIKRCLILKVVAASASLFVAGPLLNACVAFTGVERTDLSQVKSGATRPQVEEVLGEPTDTTETEFGLAAVYKYNNGLEPVNVREKEGIGYIMFMPYLWPFIEAEARELQEQQEGFLTILYDEQARVSYEFQGNQIHTIQRASSGNGDAQYQLATVSVESRWYWICHAAHHRHDEAMEEFAQAYRFGYRPMGRDLQRAMIWYLLLRDTQNTDESSLRAADKKITNNDIEQVAQELTLEQITEIELLVAAWQPNPSECGVETSQQSSQGEP